MKKLFSVILAAAMLCITSCSSRKPVEIYPPLWVVENSQTGGRVYMLGSFHMGMDNTAYSDYILDAFDSSDIIAAELDTIAFSSDRGAVNEAVGYLRCPEGTSAADYFGDSYSEVKAFYKEKRLYNSAMEGMLPYYWASVLSNHVAEECGFRSEYGTESVLLSRAKRMGKPIAELESGIEQYRNMGSIPMDIQIRSVTDCIGENYNKQEDILRKMYVCWSSVSCEGEEALAEFIEAEYTDSDSYEEYYDMMYTSRQESMAQSVTQWLENGDSVFMLVGALHYYAEPDILTLLEERGYSSQFICGCADCRAA